MKKRILNIFLFINIFKSLISEYKFSPTINYTFENFNYSITKDLGQCTCDLSNLCDYNCPCDKDCDTSYEYKERMDEFRCKKKSDTFEYNKKKAGIKIKDHIFNLMCIQYDNSGDMGEFYKETPEDENKKAKEWEDNFFKNDIKEEINKIYLYKPDSNGYCINSSFFESKNHEYFCIKDDIKLNELFPNNNYPSFGEGDNIIAVKKYNNESGEVLKSNNKTGIIYFKSLWKNETKNNNKPNGYMQGSPLSIQLGDKNTEYNQFYFPLIDGSGHCINANNINNAISMKTFLFKNNALYSCKLGGNLNDTIIYKSLCNKTKICSTPQCNNDFELKCYDASNKTDVNIQLNIYTSKNGKEYSPYEEIIGLKLYINETTIKDLLTFKIKFIDVSYSSYINTKNRKITSLINLPDDVMKALSEKKNSK